MRRRQSVLVGVLLLSVSLLFLVPAIGSAQTCNPNHPETCECNPYHPETCPNPTNTHTGAAFAVSETRSDVRSDLTMAAWVSIAIVGLALVVRRFIISSSRE